MLKKLLLLILLYCISFDTSVLQTTQFPFAEIWLRKDLNISQLETDSRGVLWMKNANQNEWISYDGKGFYSHENYKNEAWNRLDTLQLFQEKYELQDLSGYANLDQNILLSSYSKGLFVADELGKQEFFLPFNDLGKKITCLKKINGLIFFAVEEGGVFELDAKNYTAQTIPSSILPGITVNDISIDYWGNFWIASDSGLLLLEREDLDLNRKPPITQISGIYNKGDEVEESIISDTLQLRASNHFIRIDYSATHLTQAEQVLYQYQIIPLQNDWTPLSEKTHVAFDDLGPGFYTFKVRSTIDNEYFGYADPIEFKIIQTTIPNWVKSIIAGLLFLFLLAGISQIRINRIKSRSALEKERLINEKSLLELRQKALQLQMNPHFIFNSLNSIQALVALDKNEEARNYIQQFSGLMRNYLTHSNEGSISLSEEIESLKQYMNLENLSREHPFEYDISHEKVDVWDIQIPPMMIQPFVENCIVHGFKKLNHRGRISIAFKESGPILECRIIDNGVGLSTERELRPHQSMATDIIRERLKKMTHLDDPLKREEIKKEGKIEGTEVLIRLPIL